MKQLFKNGLAARSDDAYRTCKTKTNWHRYTIKIFLETVLQFIKNRYVLQSEEKTLSLEFRRCANPLIGPNIGVMFLSTLKFYSEYYRTVKPTHMRYPTIFLGSVKNPMASGTQANSALKAAVSLTTAFKFAKSSLF